MELSLDVWSYIATFIEHNQDKCRLMMTCKEISKREFYFDEPIDIEKILRLQWFDHFRNVSNVYHWRVLPKFVNKLGFYGGFHQNFTNKIPITVTHITIPKDVVRRGCRPSGHLPLNVTHLILSVPVFCPGITVSNLILSPDFDTCFSDIISEHVKYLTLHADYRYYQGNNIPVTVNEVTIIGTPSENRITYIQKFIPKNCKLSIRSDY